MTKDTASHADLTTGNIQSQLWSLSWPMMLSVFFHTLYNIVDAYWVGKLSPESIAAVSISQTTMFVMIAVGFGITVGSGVIMSMDIGARNIHAAERVLGQSFVLTAIVGVFFTAVSLFFRRQLLVLSGATGAIFEPALEYFTVSAAGSILFFILFTFVFAFNAQGETLILTKLFAVSTAINMLLDPLLIFGWEPLGIPALGIGGAATATLISQFSFILISLRALSSPARSIQFHFRNLNIRLDSVKRVMNIGVPAALTQMVNPIGVAALIFISGYAFNEPGAVAFSLGSRIEFFAYLPAIGYGFGAMAMMGQSIGAKKLDRTKAVFRTALFNAVGIACVLSIVCALFARPLIALFTTDPTVTQYALSYFRTVALSYGFLVAAMIEANAFQAVGRSWPGFWLAVIHFAVVSIPLSFVLVVVLKYPIQTMWYALIVGNIVTALVGFVWITRVLGRFDFSDVDEAIHQD